MFLKNIYCKHWVCLTSSCSKICDSFMWINDNSNNINNNNDNDNNNNINNLRYSSITFSRADCWSWYTIPENLKYLQYIWPMFLLSQCDEQISLIFRDSWDMPAMSWTIKIHFNLISSVLHFFCHSSFYQKMV